MSKKKLINIITPADTSKLYHVSLKEAANYLLDLSEAMPKDTILFENWTGYEDMELSLCYSRPETDQEFDKRLKEEAFKKELERKKLEAEQERKKKIEQYNKLKQELGIYR